MKQKVVAKQPNSRMCYVCGLKNPIGLRAAFYELENGEVAGEFWTAAQPSISTGGKIIIISTPKGNTGEYYNIWNSANKGKNDFITHKVEWDEIPGRDESFKNSTIKEIGMQRWFQ